jgi:hypothetical protein
MDGMPRYRHAVLSAPRLRKPHATRAEIPHPHRFPCCNGRLRMTLGIVPARRAAPELCATRPQRSTPVRANSPDGARVLYNQKGTP